MNINYNDSSLTIRYIQAFLQNNYSKSVKISGIYDKDTHSNLISYLSLPVVSSISDFYEELLNTYNDIQRYFIIDVNIDNIVLTSKNNNTDTINYISEQLLNNDNIYEFTSSVGWTITEFSNLNTNQYKYKIVIKASRKNIIPNNDILCMLNMFQGEYLYNVGIDLGDYTISYKPGYRIAIMDCNANTDYIMCHGYKGILKFNIYYSNSSVDIIKNSKLGEINVINDRYDSYDIKSKEYIKINSGNCSCLVVEMVNLGDINQDGFINNDDREQLVDYINGTPITGNMDALNILGHDSYYDINEDDLDEFDKYIQGEVNINSEKLLITRVNEDINFPSDSYFESPWLIHSKLLDYILNMAITPYSNEDDIKYLQDLLFSIDHNSVLGTPGVFSNDLREIIKSYQTDNNIDFNLGYLDMETEADILYKIDRSSTV